MGMCLTDATEHGVLGMRADWHAGPAGSTGRKIASKNVQHFEQAVGQIRRAIGAYITDGVQVISRRG